MYNMCIPGYYSTYNNNAYYYIDVIVKMHFFTVVFYFFFSVKMFVNYSQFRISAFGTRTFCFMYSYKP